MSEIQTDVKQLVCGICFEIFDDGTRTPKSLQCDHTCCLACVKELPVSKDHKIDCPFCRQATHLNNEPADQLMTNEIIMHEVKKLNAAKKRYEESRDLSKKIRVETIAMRRALGLKLQRVRDNCKLLESVINEKIDENSANIAVLLSLTEEDSTDEKLDIENLLLGDERLLEGHEEAVKVEFFVAKSLSEAPFGPYGGADQATFSLIVLQLNDSCLFVDDEQSDDE